MDGKISWTLSQREISTGALRRADIHDIKETEGIPEHPAITTSRHLLNHVHADSNMEELLDRAINQNIRAVVDDTGLLHRDHNQEKSISAIYCYNEIKGRTENCR